jgi:hypothetical protein
VLTLHKDEHIAVVLDGLEKFIPATTAGLANLPDCRSDHVGGAVPSRAVSVGRAGDGDHFPLA